MHIEKCSITTTETRTREMYVTETAIKTGLCGCSIWSKGGPDYTPVTLTYPAPVQVEGVRVEVPWSVIEHDVDQFLFDLRGRLLDMLNVKPTDNNAQPAPQDAGERVPYNYDTWPRGLVKVRKVSVFSAAGSCVTRYDLAGVWIDYARLTWGTLAADYELSTDEGATWQPCYQTNQPATLPWHDLGPGLSVAVVEGKGVYVARNDRGYGFSYFLHNSGAYVDLDQHPTLAAAKAACDAHHAKGGA